VLSLAISVVARAGELSLARLRFVILWFVPSFSALTTATTTASPLPRQAFWGDITWCVFLPAFEISSKQMTIFAKVLS
jgi:hypothetical protein